MIASYINIEGGANYKLDITKNDLRVQNPEFRLVCKTKDGAINIELPVINEAFESNYNAKIFIDDADDMADINNITVSLASKIVSAQKKVSSMVDVLGKVGVSVIGNFVAQLTPSIGGSMILSGFGDKSKNDGTHIIDSVELFNDGKVDAHTWFERLGLDADEILNRLKDEQGSLFDPNWSELYKSIASELGAAIAPSIANRKAKELGIEFIDENAM